jgi:hypothetical protein
LEQISISGNSELASTFGSHYVAERGPVQNEGQTNSCSIQLKRDILDSLLHVHRWQQIPALLVRLRQHPISVTPSEREGFHGPVSRLPARPLSPLRLRNIADQAGCYSTRVSPEALNEPDIPVAMKVAGVQPDSRDKFFGSSGIVIVGSLANRSSQR